MLQKFNKLAMCLISAITITSAYPSEYIVIGASEENKEKIYDIVSKFRFPSILSPFIQKEFRDRYQNYNLIETFKTKEAEYKFLQTAIREIDNKAEVNAITKSEYQFTAYDYFAKKIALNDDTFEIKSKFKIENYLQEKEEWGLTRACSRFMADKKIKDIFWKVNDHAKNLYMKHKGKTEEIINEIFDGYRDDNESREGILSCWNLMQQDGINRKVHATMSRMETMVGKTSDGKIPVGWNAEKHLALKKYITKCIISEAKNSNYNYTLYHGGKFDKPDSSVANRQAICFSDGLFSGYAFDQGASSFALSVGKNKLYKVDLNRKELLEGKCPVFITPAHHLLSGAGNGELFHARTKVVQAVISHWENNIDKCALSIQGLVGSIIPGYQLNQTPEYFTTQNPQILKRDGKFDKYTYEATGEGVFDHKGAENLRAVLETIKEIPER